MNRTHCSAWLSMTILRNSSPSMFSFSMRMAAALCRTSMLLWTRSFARLQCRLSVKIFWRPCQSHPGRLRLERLFNPKQHCWAY